MDSNQKPLPSPPPPPPLAPPKNGNTRGRPPLVSMQLHDLGDGGAVGVGNMEAAALQRESLHASCHELSRSGRHELSGSGRHELSGSGRRLDGKASSYVKTRMQPRSLVDCLGRGEATTEQHGLPRRYSRVVARLGLAGPSTIVAVDGQLYTCTNCSMTFGRESALCGHMRSHKRDYPSSSSKEEPHSTKRRRKMSRSKLRTVKPLEVTWGNHAHRNGTPRNTPAEVQVSGSESSDTIHNIEAAMQDSTEVTENDHNSNDNYVIVIDDDDDDTNPVIAIAGSRGAPGPVPDAAAALAVAPAPAMAVATPMPAPDAATTYVNTEGASVDASTTAVTIPPAPSSVTVVPITRAPLTTAMSVSTQTALNILEGNNVSSQASAHYRYGDNGKAVAGESSKVYSCRECKKTFWTHQALGGHVRSHHRTVEKKDKENPNLQSGPHKCNLCNHTCQTGQELSLHMKCVHPHPAIVASASANKDKTLEVAGSNNIGAAMDGPYNTMGRQIPSGTPRSSMEPVHQPPQSTMPMSGNPVTSHSLSANTTTSWSLPRTTSSILSAIALHNQDDYPLEQIAVVAPSNHRHPSINAALFAFSRRQEKNPLEEIVVVPSNAIASTSSTPRPDVAATESSQAIGINNYFAAIDASANAMGRHLPFFLAGSSDTQALPVSRPVHHPTQRMEIYGYPLTGQFQAASSATGCSLSSTTNNVLPSIPMQNQEDGWHSFNPALFSRRQEKNAVEEIAVVPSNAVTSSTSTLHPGVGAANEPSQAILEVNNNVAAIDGLDNTMHHLPFFRTGRSVIHAPAVSMPVHQPTQQMTDMAGNPMSVHFPTTMAGYVGSIPTITSTLPAIPLHTREENPPQGRVVPGNELAEPSQNQAENLPEETVPGNNRGRTILLFGKNIAEGQKEAKYQ